MMIPINAIVEILKQALDFTNNVVSKFDDEKYARAVNELYGHELEYSELEKLYNTIENATDISTKDKFDLLLAISDKRSELRKKEIEYKKECADIANKGFENKSELVVKIALGIFTGGLSFLPDAFSAIERRFRDKDLY